jgi:hypothetical protein
MSDAPDGKMWETIDVKERRKGALLALGLLVAACCVVWWNQLASGNFAERWWYVSPFFALVPIAAALWFRKRRLVPTPKSAAEHAAKTAETERKQREREDKWWFRYPVAVLLVVGAWYLADTKPRLWWLSLIFVLAAAVWAREFSLFLLGLVLLGAVLTGLAALPVPLAVVFAGALIAYAVYRAKDPSIDTRLPLIGGFIARRRDAKEAAKLLSTPYFGTLDTAVRAYWTEAEHIQRQVNEGLREEMRTKFIEEGADIARSEGPAMELRTRLSGAVSEMARLQVLVMPPYPEEDETGIRGQYGVSGELKARLLELATKSNELREWLHGFGQMNTWDDVWNPVLVRYFIVVARANILAALRRPLDDAHPIASMDWYKPFVATQCGYHEHVYRKALGMPSTLAADPIDASLESIKLGIFANCVVQGAKYPDLDWKDRMEKIAQGSDDD